MAMVMSSPCLGSHSSPSLLSMGMRSPLQMPKSMPISKQNTPIMPVLQAVAENSQVLVDPNFKLESPAIGFYKRQGPPPSPLWPASPPSLSQLVMRNTFIEIASPILDLSQIKRERALSDFTGLQLIEAGFIEEDWSLPPAACDVGAEFDSQGYSEEQWPEADHMYWHTADTGGMWPEGQMQTMWVPMEIPYDTAHTDQYVHDPSSETYQHNKLFGIFGGLSEASRKSNSALWS